MEKRPQVVEAGSSSHHFHQAMRSRMGLRNADLHIASQRIQKSKEPIAGKAVKPSTKQRRDLWLIDPQYLAGRRLRESPALKDLEDSCRKLCLRQILICVRDLDVGKDIATASVSAFRRHVSLLRAGFCRLVRPRRAFDG